MDNEVLFQVYMAKADSTDERCVYLDLPARPYEIINALERLRLKEGESLYFEVEDYDGHGYLSPYLDEDCTIQDLNTLAERLSRLESQEQTVFRGLLQMETDRRRGPVSVGQLIDYAYNTDCCHVVSARNDAELGRFYVENDFLPELEKVPGQVLDLLDYEKIGRQFRENEGGVFVDGCYVVQHTEPCHICDSWNRPQQKPDYIFRFQMETYPFPGCQTRTADLALPMKKWDLVEHLERMDIPDWAHCVIRDVDSALPGLFFRSEHLPETNLLATEVRRMEQEGQLRKYKAILEAMDCHDVHNAILLAEVMDDFALEDNVLTPEDLAVNHIQSLTEGASAELLLKHLDAEAYGQALLRQENAVLTPYGLLRREDGGPLQSRADAPVQTMEQSL